MIIGVDVRSLMEGRHSGVEEYAIKIIRAMMKQAPNNEWVLFYNSWRKIMLPDFGSDVQVVAFRYPNKIFNLWQYVINQPRWDKMIQRKIGLKPAVIFVPNARLMPLVDTPYVVTAHDLSYEMFPEFYSWRRRLWHKLMRPRQLLKSAVQVIAVSQATKDDLVRLYDIKPEKVTVVYSGIGNEAEKSFSGKMASQIEKSLDRRSGINNNLDGLPGRFILYLGTLEPRKNIVSIIEAFTAIAPDIPHHLVIAGESGWLGGNIKRAVSKSMACQKIHQIGQVTEAEKEKLYQAAELFIYPSFYEGFGFPPLEALLAGTPVITSNNSSLPEVAGDFATMVNSYDVAELAQVMGEQLRDRPKVTTATIEKIKQKFSWDRAARETLKILEQAAVKKMR
jgi:glycosyltransferase involved in cell wall biosynthesis